MDTMINLVTEIEDLAELRRRVDALVLAESSCRRNASRISGVADRVRCLLKTQL
jgi:hypothetical protein